MNRAPILSLALAGAIAVVGCAQTPTPPPPAAGPVADNPADIAAINAVRQSFMTAYAAGDAKAIGALYTPEAVSDPNNQPSLKGREAIVASLTGLFQEVSLKVTLTPEETRTLGSVGLDRGTYVVTATPKAGAPPSTAEGRYLVVFAKGEDGTWRAFRDMDNAYMPPVPAAPPAAPAAPTAAPTPGATK